MLRSKSIKTNLLVGAAGVAIGALLFLLLAQSPLLLKVVDGRTATPLGLVVNQRGSEVGHPEEVESDFHLIYEAILSYRKAHGDLPRMGNGQDLLAFANEGSAITLSAANLVPAEASLSDAFSRGQKNLTGYKWSLIAPRPDGTRCPSFPKSGEKDAWVYSDTYVRSNAVVYPDGTAKNKPSGFYIVLWSDGSVERIPVEQERWVPMSDGLTMYFPGQAGLPAKAFTGLQMNRATEKGVPAGVVPGGFGDPHGRK